MNRQLSRRLAGDTRQPVSLELVNRELNQLTENINQCLKAEENLRLESVREEKRFKELIANISHDLRTPLTAMKGYQQLLQKSALSKEQQEKLQIAQKYAEELGNLIEHFFEYSYLMNAELELNLEKINLTNLVTECLAASVVSLEERGLQLEFIEAPCFFIWGDREMTMRIIQNLIRNCLVHAAGDVTVQLTASENATIVFKNRVKNAAEIDVNSLFERFYTGDCARRKTTGLGLAIVKLLAEQMGGKVQASLQGNELAIQVELVLCKK